MLRQLTSQDSPGSAPARRGPQGLIICACMLCCSSAALADPSSAVRWLMNEPASLFDIGMLRFRQQNSEQWAPALNKRLERKQLTFREDGVTYSWEENIITVEADFFGPPTDSLCASTVRLYKDVVSPLRNSSPEMAVIFLTSSFDHINHSSPSAPRDWPQSIAQIVRITVSIEEPLGAPDASTSAEYRALREMAGGKRVFCTSTLSSDDVSFKRFGMK